MRQLKITKAITNRENASLDKLSLIHILALAVYRESVLHIEFLLTHVACREGGAQSVVLLVVLIDEACRSSMWRSGVYLDAICLAHVHVAVGLSLIHI